MSEITIARMHADLEAVRVAELYAGHPLLRHLPVPRFRLPNITVDIPVVIKQMEEGKEGELPRGAPSVEDMRKAFDKIMTVQLVESKVTLNPEQKNKLKTGLDKKAVSLTQPTEVSVDVNRVADEFSADASRMLSEMGGTADPAIQEKLEGKLKETARIEFLKLRKPPARLQVLVTTAEIREAGPNEVITRLQLKITEEAFEWTTIESDDQKQDRLVIE